jgi:hypothetical protein
MYLVIVFVQQFRAVAMTPKKIDLIPHGRVFSAASSIPVVSYENPHWLTF